MGRPATLKVDILTESRGRGVEQTEGKLSKLGSVGKKAGLAAAAGLAVAGAAAVKFGADAVSSASDLQQANGAVETVFGKSARSVKKWAAGAADSVGLAKSEYSNLAALVGSQLQGMGMAQDKSAGKSKDLIKLGADLAATYGGSVSDAVGAVSSVLKGETDPIERYGVSIKQADVNARLAAMGLDGLSGKAAKQAQAQAVLSLLTEQTSKAQGAFARESNTLAGQQERLKAKFENVKATVGTALLPVLTKLFAWMGDKLLPGAMKLGRQLATKLGPAFAAVGGFINGRLIPAGKAVIRWFLDKIVPGLRKYLQPILAGVKHAFGNLAGAVDRNRPALTKLLAAVRIVVEFMARRVLPIVGKAVGLAFKAMGKAIGTAIDIVGGLINSIGWAIDKVKSLIGWVKKIHIPKIDIPFVGGAIGNLTTLGPALVGRSPSLSRDAGWTSAGLATAGASLSQLLNSGARMAPAGGATYIDARTFTEEVHMHGVIDGDDAARRIEQLLRRRNRRLGKR